MIFTKETLSQMLRYIVIGMISVFSEYIILFTLTHYFFVWHIISNSIALLIVFWINFLLNRYWSFKSNEKIWRQLGLYLCLFLFNLGASNVIMYFITDIFGINYLISKAFSTAAIVSWNFVLYKKVIYK